MRKSYIAFIGVPVSVAAAIAHMPTVSFIAAIVAIVPAAGVIGRATEELAAHLGPRAGGLVNATFGNVTELVIGILLIRAGEVEVVKVSLVGSIIGNMLLVLGAAFLFGGVRHREQTFNAKVAGMHSASLMLAVLGMAMPSIFHSVSGRAPFLQTETVSLGVAGILMLLYVSSLVFSYVTHQDVLGVVHTVEKASWSKRTAMFVLAGATVLVAFESELLVRSLEPATEAFGLSKLFVGLMLIPLVGNVAEHWSAVILAMRNKVDTAIEIAVGSSIQIALLVAPLLVFVSLAMGQPMNFFFSTFEVAALGLATAVVTVISLDGRSNWLEGAQLIAAWLIMGLSFYFV